MAFINFIAIPPDDIRKMPIDAIKADQNTTAKLYVF
jgi:hypothetical protein